MAQTETIEVKTMQTRWMDDIIQWKRLVLIVFQVANDLLINYFVFNKPAVDANKTLNLKWYGCYPFAAASVIAVLL